MKLRFLHIDGFLFGWKETTGQPHLVNIEGDVWLPLCRTEEELRRLMQTIGVKHYAVKFIANAESFWDSLDASRIKVCAYRDTLGRHTRFWRLKRMRIRAEQPERAQ